MNTIALQNIFLLQSLNEKDTFSFNDHKLNINTDNNNILELEYGLYFTFHEIFTLINKTTLNRNEIIVDINNSIDNLYDNEYFLNLEKENDSFKDIMREICLKTDMITEKYLHKSTCRIISDDLFKHILININSLIYYKRSNTITYESESDSSEEDDDGFITEDNSSSKDD